MPTDLILTIDVVQPLLQQLFPKAPRGPHIAPLAADASTRRYFRIHLGRACCRFPGLVRHDGV